MPDDVSQLSVCLDANVLISAIAFGGKPALILQALLKRRFTHVTCLTLLDEAGRNLVDKIGLSPSDVQEILAAISEVSTILKPLGLIKITGYRPDDLILEAAVLGAATFL